MSDQPKLGQLIEGEAHRDAVHVAVYPVTAGCPLAPGEHICIAGGFANPAARGEGIAVVDPFLKLDVKRGEKFYAYLYPGSAVGLRHVYRHPVLDHEEIRRETIEMLTGASKKFITECAEQVQLTYPQIMEMAGQWLNSGEGVNWDPSMQGSFDFAKFWAHYEIVTGTVLKPEEKQKFFTCCM